MILELIKDVLVFLCNRQAEIDTYYQAYKISQWNF